MYFRLGYITTSMLDILGGGSDGLVDWSPRFPDLNIFDFLVWIHLKTLVHETPIATIEDLTAWIVVVSAEFTKRPDCLNEPNNPSLVDVGCATT
ncbi:hypothetical protein TNCV_1963001 [Trichonephila clavipes]|nr:hypothetical protein TNCV_1963001 [Trichonephila clavipes]